MLVLNIFFAVVVGTPSGRSNLRQLRILASLINLMVEIVCEYFIVYKVSVTYFDFGVVRKLSALLSILQFMTFKSLKT